MASSNILRVLLTLFAVVIGSCGLTAATAVLKVKRPKFPESAQSLGTAALNEPGWLCLYTRFHFSADSNQALILAFQALQHSHFDPTSSNDHEQARLKLREVLSTKPYDAELWLALGLLEAQRDPGGPAAIEALRMSYLTAPTAANLMPMRLDAATRFDALTDTDLKELVLGDVRLLLTHRHDKGHSVRLAYERASKTGKMFLEGAIGTIEPALLETIRR